MQGEYQSGAAVGTSATAIFGDDLDIISAGTTSIPVDNNFNGLQQLIGDIAAYSLSNTSLLAPYNPVTTPVMAAATEITFLSQAPTTCMTSQQQDLINRHALCLSHLDDAAEEVSSLRQENSELRSFNHHLSLLVQSYINNPSVPVGGDGTNYRAAAAAVTDFDLANRYRMLSISENETVKEGNSNESPTSVMEGSEVDRMALPKSISVRSTELWKEATAQNRVEGNSVAAVAKGRARTGCSSSAGKQKLYVRGGKREEAPVELEVYNQGMFKTELCNKWQETGTCPYADHCQFAHGIKELRPVIRHPRYKTEVCRMILAGDVCPYGHRCHFRHSLTEQERLMGMTPLQTAEIE